MTGSAISNLINFLTGNFFIGVLVGILFSEWADAFSHKTSIHVKEE